MSSRKSGDTPISTPSSDPGVELPGPTITTGARLTTGRLGTGSGRNVYQRVIVFKATGKKKKKKKKYTDGLKDLQRLANGVTDSSERLSRGLAKGVIRYRKANNKSARKKRDGILTDFLDNWSKGASTAIRVGSRAPYDFSRRINTKPYTRLVRSSFGFVLAPFFR